LSKASILPNCSQLGITVHYSFLSLSRCHRIPSLQTVQKSSPELAFAFLPRRYQCTRPILSMASSGNREDNAGLCRCHLPSRFLYMQVHHSPHAPAPSEHERLHRPHRSYCILPTSSIRPKRNPQGKALPRSSCCLGWNQHTAHPLAGAVL